MSRGLITLLVGLIAFTFSALFWLKVWELCGWAYSSWSVAHG